MKVENKEILVVSGVTEEQAVSMDRNVLQKNERNLEVHRFVINDVFKSFSNYEEGQKVKVWGKAGEQESKPPMSFLAKIEIAE